MQLATVLTTDGPMPARIDGDEVQPLQAGSVGDVLAAGPRSVDAIGPVIPLVEATLGPAVRGRTFCVGLNYRDHILEMGRELPDHPTLFAKFPDALAGPYDDVVLWNDSDRWDYEVELGVVVGREVPRHTDRETAAAAIGGYTVVNDLTARDWQKRTLQWLQGKSWEASTPVGPWVVTADELDPDGSGTPDLELSCTVDGDVRQRSRTGELVFTPADLVAYVSTFTTLKPGDLIATGTPGGVAAAHGNAGFLRPGAIVEATVERIGTCRTRCVAPPTRS